MPNYKESNVSGERYQRVNRVTIENELGQLPRAHFSEESVLNVDGETIRRPVGTLTIDFDPAGVIELVHPETGQSLGQATHAQLHVIVWSLYMQEAAKRDAGAAAG